VARVARSRWVIAVAAAVVVVLLVLLVLVISGALPALLGRPAQASTGGNGNGDAALGGTPAPTFTLVDQFGQTHALSDFHGKVVVLAFIDSRCTDICPLTARVLRQSIDQLGARAGQVQLLAINANPTATSVADVRQWSDQHGMTSHWLFLTGSADQLRPLWDAYHLDVEVAANGDVTHTPAVYLIDRQGGEQWLDLTDPSASAMPAEVSDLAHQLTGMVGR